jgi:hypothetical protein
MPAAPAPPLDRLLEAVHTLAPLIRQHAETAEQQRRLPQPVVTAWLQPTSFACTPPTPLAGGRWTR